jgi:hypothetical protein
MRVAALSANSLRGRFSPCRLMRAARRLPAEERSRGVMPAQAAKSRPQANCRPSPIAVTIAWAVRKPTPGIVLSRRMSASALATCRIFSSIASIAGVKPSI